MRAWITKLLASISTIPRQVQASLPNRCLLCHQSIHNSHTALGDLWSAGLCEVCLEACLYQAPHCLGCGKTLVELMHLTTASLAPSSLTPVQSSVNAQSTRYCGQCLKTVPLKVVAPASYHHGLGPVVAAIKYQQQLAPLKVLVAALVRRVNQLVEQQLIILPQVLLPVPLHPQRLKQRGFNQAWLIAKEISVQLNIPLDANVLKRVADTQPQAGMTGKQRRKNCHKAFELTNDIPYQRVALVDDVLTTGTTANEIAKLLNKQGVYVDVWCLARAEAPSLRGQD
ncbi:ComF family protein [Shewanella sp. SR44-3]|uniref:ComF family protein n=1 Tax=Shewanella sp. SR44-3 TaxID=2760936 RepID=UPI0015FBB9A6|nr:ComF family protein [Shewanella sp. SR44-3]MBB1268819.1 ComF family protein [Shewanella sp. SR44-3]